MNYHLYSTNCSAPCIIYLTGPFMEFDGEAFHQSIQNHTGKEVSLCILEVEDWDKMLTPWKIDEGFRDRLFAGEGRALLDRIEKELLEDR